MSFRKLPKVELHVHIEGAAPPAFIRGLAREKNLDISGIFSPHGGYQYRDFWQFLDVYEAATSAIQTPEDYHRLTLAVLEESAAQGVIYTEMFLSPDFCGGRDVAAWRDYLHAIREAAEMAEKTHGIVLRGVVTAIRHFGPDRAREAALCAALRKGLAAAAPGYRLRPQDAAPAPGSGDIGLVLVLDGQGPDRLRGHLEWRRGPRGRPETGATVTLDALDTGLRPDMFENFVTVLLRASALPFATDQTDG